MSSLAGNWVLTTNWLRSWSHWSSYMSLVTSHFRREHILGNAWHRKCGQNIYIYECEEHQTYTNNCLHEEYHLLGYNAGFLLSLFFYPEDGGDMFVQNVGWHSTDYTALYPRRWYSSTCLHVCQMEDHTLMKEILKFHDNFDTLSKDFQMIWQLRSKWVNPMA
jgi:hypothetical protein